MLLIAFGLSVCLLATLLKMGMKKTAMKFYGGVAVLGGKRNQWIEFGFDRDDHVQSEIRPLLNKS